MTRLDDALRFAASNRDRFVAELSDLVRIPSVSADPERREAVRACARWLANHLTTIGLDEVRIVETKRHPIVLAASTRRGADRRTVLVYGHYDVQPADPEREWTSPPFEPEVRDGRLYGRGASDDKGQMFAHVKALESWHRAGRGLPVNVLCVFEGEEEIGSTNLRSLLEASMGTVAADVALVSDSVMRSAGQPTITYAVRGELALELEVRGTDRDLHSGQFGGAVRDPAQALAEILATLHDRRGRVAVKGFYDTVCPLSDGERAYMARVGPTDADILGAAGSRGAWGETGYSVYERTTARPSLTINGIRGGYGGTGHKAVIPARAAAKLSVRLVPDQDPLVIESLLHAHFRRVAPPAMRITVERHMAVPPATIALDGPLLYAARTACTRGFGRPPVLVRVGGTIPVVSTLHQHLGIPPVMIGYALPDDRIHAVDEHFALDNFFGGIATSIHFLDLVAGGNGAGHDH